MDTHFLNTQPMKQVTCYSMWLAIQFPLHSAFPCVSLFHPVLSPLHTTGFYNEQTLHCLHLCHCLSLLERLLLWEGGRQLFPVTMETEGMASGDGSVLIS